MPYSSPPESMKRFLNRRFYQRHCTLAFRLLERWITSWVTEYHGSVGFSSNLSLFCWKKKVIGPYSLFLAFSISIGTEIFNHNRCEAMGSGIRLVEDVDAVPWKLGYALRMMRREKPALIKRRARKEPWISSGWAIPRNGAAGSMAGSNNR